MEWKELHPKTRKPAYDELLAFFEPHIRDLFLRFDCEMNDRFKVHNKYHRFLINAGWAYGYGRNYSCELAAVTVRSDCFNILGVCVTDETSMARALSEAKKAYEDGFEERYDAVSAKKRADQIERAEKRMAREKAEMETFAAEIPFEKFNQFNWCRKISRNNLLRLYENEAKGMIDEALLDEVGYAFYARCKQAHDARICMERGEILCHYCGTVLKAGRASPTGSVITRRDNSNVPVRCACGYSYTYREYRRSYMAVNMPGNRAAPVFEHFERKWPTCRDAVQKMLLIDWLIHECHVTLMSGAKGKSVCENLIQGTRKQITELIEKLAKE